MLGDTKKPYQHTAMKGKLMRETLISIRNRIREFEFDEEGVEQYTDTGEMWDLLYTIIEDINDQIPESR